MPISVSNPDLHLLRVFMAVTESGGFSPAQLVLNVSQSTISTQMADLESRLGMTLCQRGRSGFALTEDGRAVYGAAQELFRSCATFADRVDARRGEVSGDLRVGMADGLLDNPDFPIRGIIRSLRRQMPAVNLVFQSADPLEVERLVLERKLHTGIHTFPNHAPGLRYLKLFHERQILYCGIGHPFFDGPDAPPVKDLEQCDYASRTYYGGMLRSGIFRPRNTHASSNTMEGIVALILSGKFLGHLPPQIARPWEEAGEIRAIHRDDLSYDTVFECVFPIGTQGTRALKGFEVVLKDACADRPR